MIKQSYESLSLSLPVPQIDEIKLDVGRPQQQPTNNNNNINKPTVPTVTAAPTPVDPKKFDLMPDDAGKTQHENCSSVLIA